VALVLVVTPLVSSPVVLVLDLMMVVASGILASRRTAVTGLRMAVRFLSHVVTSSGELAGVLAHGRRSCADVLRVLR
jgi:hypothetical protein